MKPILCSDWLFLHEQTRWPYIAHMRFPALWSYIQGKSWCLLVIVWYRKIQKISPGAYIFQRPFLRGLFLKGSYIHRGLSTKGNLHFEINWASLIAGSKFTVFALFYFVFEGNYFRPSTSPWGAYIWRGDLTEDFLHYKFGGLIFGGAYFQNFMVSHWKGCCCWVLTPGQTINKALIKLFRSHKLELKPLKKPVAWRIKQTPLYKLKNSKDPMGLCPKQVSLLSFCFFHWLYLVSWPLVSLLTLLA